MLSSELSVISWWPVGGGGSEAADEDDREGAERTPDLHLLKNISDYYKTVLQNHQWGKWSVYLIVLDMNALNCMQ